MKDICQACILDIQFGESCTRSKLQMTFAELNNDFGTE